MGTAMDRSVHDLLQTEMQQFVSPHLDPLVAFTIAMSIPWIQMGTGYTFPPFKMIPAVKAKLRESQAITMILIAPYCMDASWMLELLQLSRDTSIPVVDDQKPLTQFIFSAEELRTGRAQICTCGNS